MHGDGDVELADRQSSCGEGLPAIEEIRSSRRVLSAGPVETSYGANTCGTFETGEHVGDDGRWPENVVVGEEDDRSCCFLNSSD